jgi:leucyl-tRNA synthetase
MCVEFARTNKNTKNKCEKMFTFSLLVYAVMGVRNMLSQQEKNEITKRSYQNYCQTFKTCLNPSHVA